MLSINNKFDLQLKETVQNKNIVLVDRDYMSPHKLIGDQIDTYDVVVRINLYGDLMGKRNVGIRTDVIYIDEKHMYLKDVSAQNVQTRTKSYQSMSHGYWSNYNRMMAELDTDVLDLYYIIEELLSFKPKSLTLSNWDLNKIQPKQLRDYIKDKIKNGEIIDQLITQAKSVIPTNGDKLKLHIAIPTYNRPDTLLKLLQQIDDYNHLYNISVYIYDDCSTEDYTAIHKFIAKSNLKIGYKRNAHNLGKRLYSNVYNNIFYDIKKNIADFYYQAPDDVTLVEDFFERSIKMLNDNHPADVMDTLICWFNCDLFRNRYKRYTKHGNEYFETNWCDGAYIARRSFFEKMNFEIDLVDQNRWDKDPSLGSGTGRMITRKYGSQRIPMVTKSLLFHNGHKQSQMNYLLSRNFSYDSIMSISDMIKNKRVVLVGPSPDIVGNGDKFGDFINQFDVIIRTNGGYPVPIQMQPYLGTKTDIVSINKAFYSAPNFNIKNYEGYEIKYVYDMGSLYNRNDNLQKRLGEKVLYFDDDIIQLIEERVGEKDIAAFGGMVITQQILKHEPSELYVVGISNYNGDVGHYDGYLPSHLKDSDIKERQEKFHPKTREYQKIYFKKLLKEKLIKMDKISKKHFK